MTWVAGDAGYKWFSITGPAMKDYADRVGADLIVLEGFAGQAYYLANKFRVRQVFDEYGYEFVLYIDGDILLKKGCENFFECVPCGCVGILDESKLYDFWMLANFRREAVELLRSQGMDPAQFKLPSPKNAGFYLMPKRFSHTLTPFERPFPLCFRNGATVEQTWFCLMLQLYEVPIHPWRFPEQHWLWYMDQDERYVAKSSVLHFCGMTDSEQRYDLLVAHAYRWNLVKDMELDAEIANVLPPFDRQLMIHHDAEPILKLRDNFEISSHQYGWSVALKTLSILSHPDGVLLDGFIEKTFLWDGDSNARSGKIPYCEHWIGFVHHPPGVPEWPSLGKHRIQRLKDNPYWEKSLEKCLGLVALSEELASWIREALGVQCEVLRYPALRPDQLFSMELLRSSSPRCLASIGFWMRRYTSFEALDAGRYRKVRPLLVEDADSAGMDHVRRYEAEEAGNPRLPGRRIGHVEVVPRLSSEAYDALLSQSVVFLDLIDASAVTTVVECLARTTPLLVNRLPALEEYLGEDYPFFYNDLEEASRLLQDDQAILASHEHMIANPVRKELEPQSFLNSFVRTQAYRNAIWATSPQASIAAPCPLDKPS